MEQKNKLFTLEESSTAELSMPLLRQAVGRWWLFMSLFRSILFFTVISCHSKQADSSSAAVLSQTSTTTDTIHNDESIIISERIDGPANVRERANGKLLFILNDNVPVAATQTNGKWLQVGIIADLTQKQRDNFRISKDSKILVDGKEVGVAVEDVPLTSIFKSNEGLKGELTGFTALSNIRPNTIVENAFSSIVNTSSGSATFENFNRFLKDFEFSDFGGLLPQFKGYGIEENWIDDPSPMLRVWLLFKGDNFYGVFHSRPMRLDGATTVKVKRGFYFTTFSEDQKTNKELINAFNSYIVQVD